MKNEHPTVQQLKAKFGADKFQVEPETGGLVTVVVGKDIFLEVVRFLHDEPECAYEQLTDVIGIDYQGYCQKKPGRFALVYPFLSLRHNRRIILKVYLDEPDMSMPTLTGIYCGVEWPEREAAEMFGFIFQGHPDPRRLLLCDLFEGSHPLRKDYPLKGKGERNKFQIVHRETV